MKKARLFGLLLLINVLCGCEKHDLPSVSSPVVDNVVINDSVDIGYEIKADAGYLSSTVAAEFGLASHKTDIGEDAVGGMIFITYKAGSEPGIDIVTFTIKDKEGKEATSKIEINVVDSI